MADAPTLIDNPHAPEVFADDVRGIAYGNGIVKLTFTSYRVNHISTPGPVAHVVIGRLVMPLSGARGLRDILDQHIKRMDAGESAPEGATIQ